MKGKRQKQLRRNLKFFQTNFNFTPPYRVLTDGTFCKAALKYKVNIKDQLPKYLEAETSICTTPCILGECEALGPLLFGPLKVLQQFEVHSCNHDPPIPASNCMGGVLRKQQTNKLKFMAATVDPELSDKVRKMKNVPLLFLAHSSICLEQPSSFAQNVVNASSLNKMAPSTYEEKVIKHLKQKILGETESESNQMKISKKHKGPKGPNPLSCKKKNTKDNKVNKKKKRKRVKVPSVVKDQLKSLSSPKSR